MSGEVAMDENRKRTLIIAGVFAVLGIGYFGFTEFFGDDAETPPARRPRQAQEAEAEPGRMSAEERLALRRTATIETDRFRARIDNLGGGISSMQLLNDHRFTYRNGSPQNL